eukprot:TRINITY_DN87_c0_g1_i1.p1 TRINITY_DN87_c0_g1~~TRINITY_DN87_c0_g1_i1.p1  ORF type:complete len:535 (+),score=108.25 TRINITY_DN87_c0_g1_i1:107-1711(+)
MAYNPNAAYGQYPPPQYPPQQQAYYAQQQPYTGFAAPQPYGQPSYNQQQAYGQPSYNQQPPQQAYGQPSYNQQPVHAQPVTNYQESQPYGSSGKTPDSSARFAETGEYRDVFWMVLFYAHLIAIAVILIVNSGKIEESVSDDADEVKVSSEDMERTAIFFVIACLTATALAFLSLEAMKRYPTQLLWFGMIFSLMVHTAMVILCFAYGSVGLGIVLLIFLGFHILWVYHARQRIPFSAAILEAMIECVQLYPAMVTATFAVLVVQIAWLAIWIYTASITFIAENNEDQEGESSSVILFLFLMLSYLWTSEVLKNIVHVTVAGTTATWYFHATERVNPTLQALKRALTTSFGSICLGSLIVSVVRLLRFLAESAKNNARSNDNVIAYVFLCIAECVLRIIERLIEIFNYFAYIQIAIYGSTFMQAGKDSWNLFKSSGIDLMVNDSLIDGVLLLLSVVGGMITGLATGAWYASSVGGDAWVLVALLGFLVGFLILTLVMSVVDSGVNTIFICYAEDPQALTVSHPKLANHFQAVHH